MMCRHGLVSATVLLAALAATGGHARADDPAVAAPVPTPTPVSAVVAGAERPLVTITLTNGDTFHAAIITDSDPLVIDHPLIGRMSIARERVKAVTKDGQPPAAATPPPAARAAPADAQVVVAVPPPTPAAAPAPVAPAPPQLPMAPPPDPTMLDLWKFTIEAGLNGTAGANQVQSFRALITGNRPTPEMSTTAGVGWWYTRTNDEPTAERVQVDARNEWPCTAKSPWSYFIAGRAEYDQFQPWDWRLAGQGGVGWKIIGDETLTLTSRTGFGASREFGTPHPDVHAEFTPSVEVEYKINARNKLCGAAAAWVDLENTSGSRVDLKAWYEAVLDPDTGMSLKLGVEDRYERSPGLGREAHEVDYYAVIVFNF